MAFYQLFHQILHEIDRFGCFMLKSGFFSKSLVLCLSGLFLKRSPPRRGYYRDYPLRWCLSLNGTDDMHSWTGNHGLVGQHLAVHVASVCYSFKEWFGVFQGHDFFGLTVLLFSIARDHLTHIVVSVR